MPNMINIMKINNNKLIELMIMSITNMEIVPSVTYIYMCGTFLAFNISSFQR